MKNLFYDLEYAINDIQTAVDNLASKKLKAEEIKGNMIKDLNDHITNCEKNEFDFPFEEGTHIYKIGYHHININVDEGIVIDVFPFIPIESKGITLEQ